MNSEGSDVAAFLEANLSFVEDGGQVGALSAKPARRLAVVACMDARLDIEGALGLVRGDAHLIRNAGGLATDDAIRSLVISVHQLGTNQIFVIAHTQCGLLTLAEDALRQELAVRTGAPIHLPLLTFNDLEASLRAQIERLEAHPWLASTVVEGFIYDTDNGRLRHFDARDSASRAG